MKNFTTWHKKEPRINQITWRMANRQKPKEVQADKKKRILDLEAKYLRLAERTAELALQAQIQAIQICPRTVSSSGNRRLAKKYSKAACQMTGRVVEVQLRKPSTKESAGTFSRSLGQGHIQLDPELSARSIVRIFLHEAAHAMLHYDTMKPSKAHLYAPRSKDVRITNPSRHDRLEKEADGLADKLIACVEFDVDPSKLGYEDRALDYLILHS